MLNVAVSEISLEGCALKASLAFLPARSTIRANPAVLNGCFCSDVNTKMTSTPAHAEAAVRLAPSGGPSVQMPAGHAFKNAAYGLPNGTPGGTPSLADLAKSFITKILSQ